MFHSGFKRDKDPFLCFLKMRPNFKFLSGCNDKEGLIFYTARPNFVFYSGHYRDRDPCLLSIQFLKKSIKYWPRPIFLVSFWSLFGTLTKIGSSCTCPDLIWSGETQFYFSFWPGLIVSWIDENPISWARPNFEFHSGTEMKIGSRETQTRARRPGTFTRRHIFFFPGAIQFSRKHPFSLWIASMMYIFAGSMLANGILGEPVLTPLKNINQLFLTTCVW